MIRPLLLARRVDVEAHLARHGLVVGRDPSNDEARFLRVRVRKELLPLMEEMGPGVAEHLCALAEMLADLVGKEARGDELVELGRAQRIAVARAKKCERAVNLLVSGGREVMGAARVALLPRRRARRGSQRGRKSVLGFMGLGPVIQVKAVGSEVGLRLEPEPGVTDEIQGPGDQDHGVGNGFL